MPSARLTSFFLLFPLALLIVSAPDLVDAQKQASKESAVAGTEQARKLTAGEKQAILKSTKLAANTVAIFDKNGKLVKEEKVDPNQWSTLSDYAAKICVGPVPISPKCVRCKNGEIICTSLPAR